MHLGHDPSGYEDVHLDELERAGVLRSASE
jgi:hypothetical protein